MPFPSVNTSWQEKHDGIPSAKNIESLKVNKRKEATQMYQMISEKNIFNVYIYKQIYDIFV